MACRKCVYLRAHLCLYLPHMAAQCTAPADTQITVLPHTNVLFHANVLLHTNVLFHAILMHAGNNPILKMLRLMRIFRVARLFKKIRSLNRIMHSLVAALLPVCNSFVILVLVTGTVAVSLCADISFLHGCVHARKLSPRSC